MDNIYIYIYICAINKMTLINDYIIIISAIYWFVRDNKNDREMS